MAKPSKSKKPADTRTQKQRFMDFAQEHGADDPDALDRAVGRIGESKKSAPKDERK